MGKKALLVAALVSLLFLGLFLSKIDRAAVLAALAGADYRWLGLAAFLQLPFYGVKVLRWRWLLPAICLSPARWSNVGSAKLCSAAAS